MKSESCGSCPSKSACGVGCERSEQELAEMYDLDADTSEGVMVWAEWRLEDGVPVLDEAVPGLLGAAALSGQRVFALVFGPEGARPLTKDLHAWGAGTVYHVRDPGFVEHRPEAFSEGFAAVAERVQANTALFPAGERGDELALMTASRLGVAAITGAARLDFDGGRLIAGRPAQGGMEACVVSEGRPQIATVRKEALAAGAKEEGRRGTFINWPYRSSGNGPAARCSELLLSVEGVDVTHLEAVREKAEALAEEIRAPADSPGPRVHLRLAPAGTPWPQGGGGAPPAQLPDDAADRVSVLKVEGEMGPLIHGLLDALEWE